VRTSLKRSLTCGFTVFAAAFGYAFRVDHTWQNKNAFSQFRAQLCQSRPFADAWFDVWTFVLVGAASPLLPPGMIMNAGRFSRERSSF